MKRLLLKSVLRTQAHRATRWWNRRRPAVLAYHGLTDASRSLSIENSHGKHLPVDTFRQHLEYLRRHHEVISLDRLVDHYEHGRPLPARSVVLTFDDGYQSVHRLAWPLLREFSMPATAFLATNFVAQRDWLWTDRLEYALSATTAPSLDVDIGDRRMTFLLRNDADKAACDSRLRSAIKAMPQEALPQVISDIEYRLAARLADAAQPPRIYQPLAWSDVREMLDSGLMAIGSHTASHVILARCGRERVLEELETSRTTIESHTGGPCTLFCYPNGTVGCFNDDTKALLRLTGFRCGLTTVEGVNDDSSDVFELRRLSVVDWGHPARFQLTVSGMMGPLDALQNAFRRPRNGSMTGARS